MVVARETTPLVPMQQTSPPLQAHRHRSISLLVDGKKAKQLWTKQYREVIKAFRYFSFKSYDIFLKGATKRAVLVWWEGSSNQHGEGLEGSYTSILLHEDSCQLSQC